MTKLFRNTFFMLLFNVFGRASGFLRYLVFTAFLDKAEWGILFYALQFSGIARHFIDGGLDNLVTRDGARRKDLLPTFTVTALAIKCVLAVLFFGITLCILGPLNVPKERHLVTLTAVLMISGLSLTGVLRSGFSALERMEYVFYTHSPCRVVSLILTVCALAMGLALPLVVVAVFTENILWFGLSLYFIHRFYRLSDGTVSFANALAMLKESWPLAIYGFFNVLYLRMDTLMIQWLTGFEETGIYGTSMYLVEGVTLVVSGYIVAVFPIFSNLYPHHEERFRGLYTQSLAVMVALTLPAALFLGGFADVWARILPGGDRHMTVLLPLLGGTMVSAICNSFLIAIFTARNRQRWLVVFLGLAVGVSFATNYILIPRYGFVGAAVASLFSQGLLFLSMLTVLRVRMALTAPLGRWLKVLLAGLLAFGLARLLPEGIWYLRPVVFAVLAPAALLGLRIVSLKDVQEFRRLAGEAKSDGTANEA